MKLFYVSLALILMASCGPSEKDFENAANDACGCFDDLTTAESCFEKLDKEYNIADTEENRRKLIEKMKKIDGCGLWANLLDKSIDSN